MTAPPKCFACGTQLEPGADFCSECGWELGKLSRCPYCESEVSPTVQKCRHCGEWLRRECLSCGQPVKGRWAQQGYCSMCEGRPQQPPMVAPPRKVSTHSDGLAFILGLFLGPVGLWYKGNWAAGFAWLAVALLIGWTIVAIPFIWLGMAIHAASARPK